MILDVSGLPPGIIANAVRLLGAPDAVLAIDPDHYTVASLRHAGRHLRVYRNGSRWRCSSDRRSDQDAPCAHILAVLAHQGVVALPRATARDGPILSELEQRVTALAPTRVPGLLAQLLTSNPGDDAPYSGYGRPPRPVYPQAFQALARAAFKHTINGYRDVANDCRHNPWGSVSRATLARFLDSPAQSTYIQTLAEATVAPARASEPATWLRHLLRFTKADGTYLDLSVLTSPRYNLWLPTTGAGDEAPDLVISGGAVAFTHPTAQLTEALCLVVAHNLHRLVALELAEALRVQFHRAPPPTAAAVGIVAPPQAG